jgi:hypothetical protein
VVRALSAAIGANHDIARLTTGRAIPRGFLLARIYDGCGACASDMSWSERFIGRETLQGVQAPGEIVGGDEVAEMFAKLIAAFVGVAFDPSLP